MFFIYPFTYFSFFGFFFFQENNVVPLIKFFSFLCVLLGFTLLVLRMEYQPSFTKNWFNEPLDQPLDMEPFDWGIETTKSTDDTHEGGSGKWLSLFTMNFSNYSLYSHFLFYSSLFVFANSYSKFFCSSIDLTPLIWSFESSSGSLEHKVISQIETLIPHGISERFSVNSFCSCVFYVPISQPVAQLHLFVYKNLTQSTIPLFTLMKG